MSPMSFTYFSLRTQLLDITLKITFGIDESKWSWALRRSVFDGECSYEVNSIFLSVDRE